MRSAREEACQLCTAIVPVCILVGDIEHSRFCNVFARAIEARDREHAAELARAGAAARGEGRGHGLAYAIDVALRFGAYGVASQQGDAMSGCEHRHIALHGNATWACCTCASVVHHATWKALWAAPKPAFVGTPATGTALGVAPDAPAARCPRCDHLISDHDGNGCARGLRGAYPPCACQIGHGARP